MTAERYRKIYDWFSAHPRTKKAVILLNRWLPAVPFVLYLVLLVMLNVQLGQAALGGGAAVLHCMQQIARAILVPGWAFLIGTTLRRHLNWPRPYEQPGFVPLVEKQTRGHSFPSRHAVSAAVIAMAWLYFCPPVGWVLTADAAAICVLRVLVGVHFPRDVLCGAALGFALGAAGMWL